ncbi:Phosphatidylinositol alpha-mannosyltransferase [Salinihabitans flavidus]|uniref:Phosphatidylinositol alpha-mannosyltransferase n=1 Tax=Salinihabitans flavidus TaxID=569882 RepID=A0A1H8SL74_9RHOB|nr:glycosyltransferase family 4 protein [Salinihabitans flavidus]SEO79325.1 Phosphatidylinositol alpha-mannosyltransferase [Salinihabitans flavidus]
MKIVQISPYPMSRPGGVQSNIRDLSEWLRAQGHEVRIVAPPGGAPGTDKGLIELGKTRVVSIHGTTFELSRASRPELTTCVADLRDWGADVVHLHTPWTPMLAWQLWRRLSLPSVATFHATLPRDGGLDPVSWFLRRAARYFHRRLDAIIVPSKAPQDQWRALGLSPAPQILPPAIDLSAWRAARRAQPPRTGPFHVVYMGRLEERKGVRILLDAWPEVVKNMPDARLTIAGSGTLEGAIKDRVASMNLPGLSLRPAPANTPARALIASADVFAAPALHGESFGLVLIEAMSAGALPVAAANEGFSTVMTGEGEELLTPPGDASALAEKLIALARDDALRERLGIWAQNHALRFDVVQQGPAYLGAFERALG